MERIKVYSSFVQVSKKHSKERFLSFLEILMNFFLDFFPNINGDVWFQKKEFAKLIYSKAFTPFLFYCVCNYY